MPATLVHSEKTTYTQSQMIEGFIKGWIKAFHTKPEKKSIGVLFSQNALETGGTKSMWNNNVGNVKFVESKNPEDDNGKEYMMLTNVWEIIGGKKVIFQPPHKATWFRAFSTLEEGVADHLNFLKNTRYKKSWIAVENGNPEQFASLLKVQGYYTAPVEDYTKAMRYFFDKYMKDSTFEDVLSSIDEVKTNPDLKMDIEDVNLVVDTDSFTKKDDGDAPENIVLTKNKWQSFLEMIFAFISKIFAGRK